MERNGTNFLFTLCGGHISPILLGCQDRGIRVIDTRHEASAVFAADANSRLTGIPGVAAVTAGPGLTNTITAVKNAELAESPIVVLGGATATVLKGRGALQDIDQRSLMKPHVKWMKSISKVKEIGHSIDKAFSLAVSGVPGPVYIEFPIDVLYPEDLVRSWYAPPKPPKALLEKVFQLYLSYRVNRIFSGSWTKKSAVKTTSSKPNQKLINQLIELISSSERPLMILSNQSVQNPNSISDLIKAIENLNIPIFLSGMARGLLGKSHKLQYFHNRSKALRQADLVILGGVSMDFRLDYGRHINRSAHVVSINKNKKTLNQNKWIKRVNTKIHLDVASTLIMLSNSADFDLEWKNWNRELAGLQEDRLNLIEKIGNSKFDKINPIYLCQEIEKIIEEDSLLVADGGDFVATLSYIVKPRGPLRWLDPGPFGTLGPGGGFAMGSKLCNPSSEVWLIYGDGSAGYSLAEYDTFVRHKIPVIGIVGNDASWAQIEREQVKIFKSDLGTKLLHTNYHEVVKGYGAEGLLLEKDDQVPDVLTEAKEIAGGGVPVLINALISKTDFRKGSISI